MVARLFAILFIFLCTALAWAILGTSIASRAGTLQPVLRSKVSSTWGTPQTQTPPAARYYTLAPRKVESVEDGKKIVRIREEKQATELPLEASDIQVDLDLEHRRKGLLWYSTYKVAFQGAYDFRNPSGERQEVHFVLQFPAAQAIYDDFQFTLNGAPLAVEHQKNSASATAVVEAGATARLRVGYRSQGLESWRYRFGEDVSAVRGFALKARTNFADIDFPEGTLSPTSKREAGRGWELEWRYKNLVAGYQIGITMPEKLQPGPLAGRISYFAPVSLFFFFFLMFVITTLRRIDLHPMNYLFLAAAFFAFHLLQAYLVDHISIHAAFAISSVVSIFLVVSYLRLVVGMRFALVEAAGTQFVYLVLFSYAFFFEGFTGLAITIGSILTLFVVMQITGRIRWSEQFARRAG